ncbi:MAG: hypothetical protein M1817_000527 [Caeruleum heppii]|nr:MAG: hypothetical protein M1817_000527 [Caeruleum heppii]
MLAQRGLQQSMRRFTSSPSAVNRHAALLLTSSTTPPSILPYRTPIRTASTTKTTPEAATSLLATQRLHRPVAPHLTIYRPQVTWTLSALNRITGSLLSGGFYLFGAAYLVAPLVGWHLESASMAAAVAGWPVVVKVLAKFTIAWPFAFHSFNGVRHLVWDMGRQFSNLAVQRTGWAVVGVSTVASLVLAMM